MKLLASEREHLGIILDYVFQMNEDEDTVILDSANAIYESLNKAEVVNDLDLLKDLGATITGDTED